MSSISRWSYTNIATVWPFESEDQFSGVIVFGTPYTVACTWTASAEQHRDATGAEFIAMDTYWMEDDRPKYRDFIARGDQSGLNHIDAQADEIRKRDQYDMSPFGEADSPDFALVTG